MDPRPPILCVDDFDGQREAAVKQVAKVAYLYASAHIWALPVANGLLLTVLILSIGGSNFGIWILFNSVGVPILVVLYTGGYVAFFESANYQMAPGTHFRKAWIKRQTPILIYIILIIIYYCGDAAAGFALVPSRNRRIFTAIVTSIVTSGFLIAIASWMASRQDQHYAPCSRRQQHTAGVELPYPMSLVHQYP